MQIHSCLSNLAYTKNIMPRDIPDRSPLFLQVRRENPNLHKKTICISDHAVDRWNERVGPLMNKGQLTELLEQLWNTTPYRFYELLKDEAIWMLDDEVVFAWYYFQDKYHIVTFYGRKSANPALQNMRQLRNFNHQHHDEVALSLERDTLTEQRMPYVPKSVFLLTDKCFLYYVEEIAKDPWDLLLLTILQVNHQTMEHFTFQKNELEEIHLSKKVRTILGMVYPELSQVKVLEQV